MQAQSLYLLDGCVANAKYLNGGRIMNNIYQWNSAHFEKCEQLLEYQIVLLLRDI